MGKETGRPGGMRGCAEEDKGGEQERLPQTLDPRSVDSARRGRDLKNLDADLTRQCHLPEGRGRRIQSLRAFRRAGAGRPGGCRAAGMQVGSRWKERGGMEPEATE